MQELGNCRQEQEAAHEHDPDESTEEPHEAISFETGDGSGDGDKQGDGAQGTIDHGKAFFRFSDQQGVEESHDQEDERKGKVDDDVGHHANAERNENGAQDNHRRIKTQSGPHFFMRQSYCQGKDDGGDNEEKLRTQKGDACHDVQILEGIDGDKAEGQEDESACQRIERYFRKSVSFGHQGFEEDSEDESGD